MEQQRYTRQQFAAKIKEEYPAYAEMDDNALVDKITAKYPQYLDQIEEGKTNATAEETALVVAEDTESQLEDGFLELQGNQQGPSEFADPLEPSILEPASFEQEYNLKPILTNSKDISAKVDGKFSDIPAEQIKNKDFNLTLNSITEQLLKDDDLLSTFYDQITPTLQPKIDAKINELKSNIDLTSEEAVASANKEIQGYVAGLYNNAYENSTSVKQRRDEILNAVNRKVNGYALELYNAEADRIEEENENIRKAKAQVLVDFHPLFGSGPFRYLPNDFRTAALQTMASFTQSLDYTQMHGAGVKVAKANEAIEKMNEQDAEIDRALAEGEIGPKKAESLRSTFQMPGTGRPIKYKGKNAETREEAIAGLEAMKVEAGKEFLKQMAEGQEYQETIETLGSGPQLFNENGDLSSFSLDAENFNKGMGSQTVQMALSLVGGTVPQEIAGMTMEALEAAVTKGGDEEAAAKFYSLSQKEQNQKMLEAIDNGDVDLDNIVGSAILSGGFDMFSGYLTAGGVKLAPKGVINNLFKGRARRGIAMRNLRKNLTDPNAIKQFSKILATETGTEALQENLSMSTAGSASGYDLFNKARMMEAAGLALITTGPITTVSTGLRKAKNEAYRGFSGLMSEDAIRSSVKRKKADLEQKYKDGELNAQEVSDRIDELNIAEDVLYNTPKIQRFEPEAKENIIKNQIEKTKLEKENQEIDQSLMGDFSIFGKGKKAKNEERLKKLEDEREGILYQQQTLNSARRFRSFVNSNKDFFNGYTFKFFNTKEDLKKWAEDNNVNYSDKKNTHLKGAIEGKAFGVTLPEQKVFLAVKETANSTRGSFLNRLAGGNVVFHEGAHAVMSSATDEEIEQLHTMMDEFAKQNPDTKYGRAWNLSKTVTEGTSAKKGTREFNEEVFARMSDMSRSDLSLDNVSVGDVTVLSKIGDKLADFFNIKAKGAVDFSGFSNAEEVITFFDKYNNYNNKPAKTMSLPKVIGVDQSDEQRASEVVQEVKFEEDSINEQFKAFDYDGKKNTAPEAFQAEAAMAYEPLAQAVVDRISKVGLGVSKEQDQFIMDYLSDNQNKQDIVSDLTFGTERNKASSLLGLAKSYNPEVGSFGGYAKSQLANRAIRILEERVGKQVTQGAQTIDAPESKEIEAGEQQIEITQPVVERLKLNDKISEDLNKLGEMATIQAEKAITSKDLSDLKKVNIRNKTFGDIFAKRLFNDVKDVLGKNTKTKSDFTDFLNNNYDALSDIALNYIDFQKGSGPAVVWSLDTPPSKGEFVEYYEAKGEKASTRGDRKKSLNNAIARAISNDVRNKMVDDNPSINEGFEKVAGIPLASEVLYDLVLDEKLKMLQMLAKQDVDITGAKLSSLKTEEEVKAYFDEQEKSVWPLLPKRFLIWTEAETQNQYLSKSGKEILAGKSLSFTEAERNKLREFTKKEFAKRINKFKNFGPEILIDGKPVETYVNQHYSKAVQKPLEAIAEKRETQKDRDIITAFNKRNKAIGREIYSRFNKAVQDDKQNAIGIAGFLQLAGNNTEHFNRALAEVVAISIDPKGGPKRKYEWEHAMQQAHVSRLLLEGMLDDNRDFDTEFDAIMANYKLIGLDYALNDLLKQGGFEKSMTGKLGGQWDILKGTWLSRYFNDIIAELGGINPAKLMHVSGVTLDKYYNIDTNGNSTGAFASEILSDEFNQMLERVKGVKAEARYSEDRANKLAGNKGKFKFFVPYSAEDYVGLIYPTLGKGKEGDRNLQWYKDNIINPFAVGIANFEKAKVESLEQWRDLKKQISKTPAKLNKEAVRGFTNEEALRVYLWNEQDVVPDTLAKKDVEALVKHVEDSKELSAFAENVKSIVGVEGYPAPGNNWLSGSLTIDLIDNINTGKRSEFLQQWQDNVDVVYSKDNMNKLKALYGERYTEALENILYRMKTGRNRPSGATRLENQFMNWVNDSVGTVMFFNTRSALLQTISAVNFLNWSDNNPLMAAKAFANQPRFWKDFADLFNSDFLKSRRSGLKNDINADELAKSAATADNKVRAGLSAILKAGFLPTQIADSFAISIGGASFYRNRLNTYKKQGLSEEQAKEKAMLDFQETAEESQQSSRPDRVSMQQASSLGRVILAFANTPMQYTRLTKKAALDLVNGRGDWKTNMSKILYYGAVQNIIFTALQQAMFAMLFDDDEIDDEEQTEASTKIVNGIADTFLRGSGVGGAAVATMKNIIMEIIKQKESKRPDYTKAALKLTTLSPPIDTKIRKLMSAGRAFTYRQSLKDMNRLGVDIDNPAALATGQVLSAVANLPADRAILKMRNVKGALDTEHEAWQRIALGLGFSDWQLGIEKDKSKTDKTKAQIMKELKKSNPFEYKRRKAEERREKKKAKRLKKSPTKKLERGVAGRANNDGTIEIDPNLTPVEREKTIAHEEQHMKDMKAKRLNYDDNYVYWNGVKYERKNGKIKYKGKFYIEGHKDLPWEKKAYAAEPSTAEAKKRIKLYA